MITRSHAAVVESVDTGDLKSPGSDTVRVRVPSAAPKQYNPNQLFRVGNGFGFIVFFGRFEDTHFRSGVTDFFEIALRKTEYKNRFFSSCPDNHQFGQHILHYEKIVLLPQSAEVLLKRLHLIMEFFKVHVWIE